MKLRPKLQDKCGVRPGPGCLPRLTSLRRPGDDAPAGPPDMRPVASHTFLARLEPWASLRRDGQGCVIARHCTAAVQQTLLLGGMGRCRWFLVTRRGYQNWAPSVAEALGEALAPAALAPTVCLRLSTSRTTRPSAVSIPSALFLSSSFRVFAESKTSCLFLSKLGHSSRLTFRSTLHNPISTPRIVVY